ncbi:LOW QUALITY PROTEIN: hypothetical protein Cgig2_003991 [Carnegiea gigantea]|uniref:PGG domain-containing protein n=1 Tax=Carnegiea gigantea TaxID=171969 RepID=A0A9Q1KAJ2_9CARY|nr:LOW QUALITY PROTEIN: hypothetical protein Cgig2_003991 [Carnegiea gigantea]
MGILTGIEEKELQELLAKQNQAGETALYSAAEYGQVQVIRELIKFHDLNAASIKAKNGYDAFHVAANQGSLGMLYISKILFRLFPWCVSKILKILMEAYDTTNTTALQTAATQGHIEVVNFLLESGTLHAAARNGHLSVVKTLLEKEAGHTTRPDRKGQTALHMAVKGQSLEAVNELINADPSSINMADTKGNIALHVAARKCRAQIVRKLLAENVTDTTVVNRAGETALDTAKKMMHPEIAESFRSTGCRVIKPLATSSVHQLKQTVSDIKYEVHYQLEHTRQTRKRVQGIAERLNKMHAEGLNIAINSTTVVAVLIATPSSQSQGNMLMTQVTFTQWLLLEKQTIAPQVPFMIFFVLDSVAIFISLGIVVVQTSMVVIESKAKKQMMAIINKLIWLACVLIPVAFLALAFYCGGGENERWLAIGVTVIGATIMASTIGTMCYWAKDLTSLRKSSLGSRTRSLLVLVMSDSEILNSERFILIPRMYKTKQAQEIAYDLSLSITSEEIGQI